MNHDNKIKKLADVAARINGNHAGYLDKLKKGEEDLNRKDFIWHFLLQSFATMGRSSGWKGLIGNKDNYNKVTFESLASYSDEDRKEKVRAVCWDAKIRMPDQKTEFILGCFELVKKLGGLEKVKDTLLSIDGREGKMKFLKQFPGIGPKYARNIMMNVYHEDFRDSIAIDVRIKAISESLGLSFRKYEDQESFFLKAAELAGLNGWELDRLMYNFREEFECEIALA